MAVGFGMLTTLGFPVFASYIDEGEEGLYSGLYFSVRSVASAVALPLAGWTIALTDSYRTLFVIGGLAALAAVIPLTRLEPGRLRSRISTRRWDRAAAVAGRAAVLALATALALGAAVVIHRTELAEADEWLFDLLYGLGSSPRWLDDLVVSPHIRNYVIITAVAGIAALRWGSRSPLRTMVLVATAGLVAYAAVRTCWALWERPRPEEALGVPAANAHAFESYGSFPSGHVAVATALVAAATALVPPLRVPLWFVAGVIALTRITYGAHLPSDVVFAAVLGYLAATVVLPPAAAARLRDLHVHGSVLSAARISAVGALTGFLVLLATVGAPASPEGGVMRAALEHDLQIGLLAAAAVCIACAFRWPLFGGALAVVGAGLGVFAALEYTPGFAAMAFLAFAVPATLFLLASPRARRPHGAAAVAAFVALVAVTGAYAAITVHEREYGPAHPASTTPAPETWRVEWIWAGGVTSDSVEVRAKLNDEGRARLLVSETRDLREPVASTAAEMDDDEPAAFTVRGLRAGTTYYYAVEFEGRPDRNRIGTFRTFPRGAASFTFAFSSCARVGSNGAVFDAIRREHPLLYLTTGDLFYANIDENSRGRFLDEYQRALGQPAQDALHRTTPIAYTWDDHDFGGDGSDATAESRPAATWSYRAAVPHYPLPRADGPIYQAFTVGRVRFVLLDTRSERTPATMLGARQRAWLERELLAARDGAGLTVLVTSVPWIGDVADGWGGYAAERASLSRFIARHRIDNLLMLGGDAHMVAIDDGSHSDYSGTGRAGFPVMHAGALDRAGSVKGGPYSEGTFPGAGQYGTVRVDDRGGRIRITLTGRRYDGATLVRHEFTVSAP